MPVIPRGSKEFLSVPVTLTGDAVPVNPTVHMAVIPVRTHPVATDWRVAQWLTTRARILLDGTLAPGVYGVWVRVTDVDEVPIRYAGQLTIT